MRDLNYINRNYAECMGNKNRLEIHRILPIGQVAPAN